MASGLRGFLHGLIQFLVVSRTELKTNLERICFLSRGKFCVKSGKTVACQRKASWKAVNFWKEIVHLRQPEKISAGF